MSIVIGDTLKPGDRICINCGVFLAGEDDEADYIWGTVTNARADFGMIYAKWDDDDGEALQCYLNEIVEVKRRNEWKGAPK